MILCILGCIVIAYGIYIWISDYDFSISIFLIAAAFLLFGHFGNFGGYNPPEKVNEIKLDAIYEKDGKNIYAICDEDDWCLISYTEESETYGKSIKKPVIKIRSTVEIQESEEVTQAVLIKAVKKPKKNLFTYRIGMEGKIDTLLLPKGSVRR